MSTTLNLVFEKASKKKHVMKIADAKASPAPLSVKALMDYIVSNNLILVKEDTISSAIEANLQNVTETQITL